MNQVVDPWFWQAASIPQHAVAWAYVFAALSGYVLAVLVNRARS